MTPTAAISLLTSALVGGALVVVSIDDLSAIHAGAVRKTEELHAANRAQVLEAAQVMYELSGGPAHACPEELVAQGYLKPAFLTRQPEQPAVPPAVPSTTE
jgi:hypothetical protein